MFGFLDKPSTAWTFIVRQPVLYFPGKSQFCLRDALIAADFPASFFQTTIMLAVLSCPAAVLASRPREAIISLLKCSFMLIESLVLLCVFDFVRMN
jgi:hypothetical protein